MHDVIGCYLDLDTMQIKFTKNGKDLGVAFTIPAALRDVAFFPAVVLKVSNIGLISLFNEIVYLVGFFRTVCIVYTN